MIKQISVCKFIDISEDRNYFIHVTGEVLFFDNNIENTGYRESAKSPGVFWADYNNGKLVVTDCKFTKVNGRGRNGNILTTNGQTSIEIIYDKCDFTNCSESPNRPLVNFERTGGSIKFNTCSFIFNDAKLLMLKQPKLNLRDAHLRNVDQTLFTLTLVKVL